MDCMAYMKGLPDKCFSLAVADPPYGLPKTSTNSAGKLKNRIINRGHIQTWDTAPDDEFFKELFRVSRNQIIWGGNHFGLPPTRCFVCWDKVQPWDNFAQVEYAWTSFNGPAKLFRFDNRTGGKIHPCQKPVELYAWLLRNFANEGDSVFDPMMGSGSSRIAAYKMGFDFYGCELNSTYFIEADERFRLECLYERKLPNGMTEIQTQLFDEAN